MLFTKSMASSIEPTNRRRGFRPGKWIVIGGSVVLLWFIMAIVIGIRSSRPSKPNIKPRAKAQARQNPAPAPDLPPPQFSVPGGIYTNTISVRLTASSRSTSIHYTVDGSEPTPASRTYSDPIQISSSTLLKAKVFGTGLSVSATVRRAYIRPNSDLEGFSSNLPLIILNTFGQRVPKEEKLLVAAHFVDSKGSRSTLAGAVDFDGSADLNIRGHTSLRYPKHSYHLKIKDDGHNPLKIPL